MVADATIAGGLGTFGYDDEGVPPSGSRRSRRRVPGLPVEPRDRRLIGGRSNATMRADGWEHLPLIRMTNINLEPGEGSLEEIVGDTADGILMATNQSWSIDDKRRELPIRVRDRVADQGRQADRAVPEPELHGYHDRVLGLVRRRGGREEWVLWGTPNCGKGQPGQTARVGHGTPPARFRNVQVGVR